MSIKLTSDDINFEKATPVISNAQKFVLPIPAFADGGEPLVYPNGNEQAGQPIADWEGKPIGDNGVVFFNAKDQAVQAVPGDGTGVIIMNEVTEEQGKKLSAKIDSLGGDPTQLSLAQVKDVLSYAQDELGLKDMYNSDKGFIASKMNPLEKSSTGIEAYGLHRRDDRDICQAVFVHGEGEFQGPAATPQKFENGAVILKQGDDVRLIQPEEFRRTYTGVNGEDIAPRFELKVQPTGPIYPLDQLNIVQSDKDTFVVDGLNSGQRDAVFNALHDQGINPNAHTRPRDVPPGEPAHYHAQAAYVREGGQIVMDKSVVDQIQENGFSPNVEPLKTYGQGTAPKTDWQKAADSALATDATVAGIAASLKGAGVSLGTPISDVRVGEVGIKENQATREGLTDKVKAEASVAMLPDRSTEKKQAEFSQKSPEAQRAEIDRVHAAAKQENQARNGGGRGR